MLNVTGLDHIGLKVTDLDRSLHFYHDVLGLEVLHTSGPHANVTRGGTTSVYVFDPDGIHVELRLPVVMASAERPAAPAAARQ